MVARQAGVVLTTQGENDYLLLAVIVVRRAQPPLEMDDGQMRE